MTIALVHDRRLFDAVTERGVPDGIELLCDRDEHGRDAEVEVWVAPYAVGGAALDGIERFPRLRLAQVRTAGYDHLVERLPSGVSLAIATGVHDDATAEHAVGLVVATLRGVPEAVRAQQAGSWERHLMRRSLADSRVLILGYGSIGRSVAERLLAMKAVVTGVASSAREDDLLGSVHGADELVDLLPDQHVVVVVLPLSEATRHTVDAAFLARLPDEALVVNVARGPVADTDAILAETGRLRFALDVTDPEPLPEAHPLWTAPGVLITPHVAGGTTAMLPRMADLVVGQLEHLAAGREPEHVVASG